MGEDRPLNVQAVGGSYRQPSFHDAETNEVVGAFRDREQGKSSLASVRDVTWYGHAEAIMADWTNQFVQVFNSSEDEYVKDSPTFTLNPF